MNECVCLRTSADQLHWTGRGEGSGCYYCDMFALRASNVAYSRRIRMFHAIYVLNADALPSHITMSCTKSFASCHQDYIRHATRFLLADCFYKFVVLRPALVLAASCCRCCHVLCLKVVVPKIVVKLKQKYSL